MERFVLVAKHQAAYFEVSAISYLSSVYFLRFSSASASGKRTQASLSRNDTVGVDGVCPECCGTVVAYWVGELANLFVWLMLSEFPCSDLRALGRLSRASDP